MQNGIDGVLDAELGRIQYHVVGSQIIPLPGRVMVMICPTGTVVPSNGYSCLGAVHATNLRNTINAGFHVTTDEDGGKTLIILENLVTATTDDDEGFSGSGLLQDVVKLHLGECFFRCIAMSSNGTGQEGKFQTLIIAFEILDIDPLLCSNVI